MHISEPDYKYQFRKWKWKKNVPAVKKTAILEMGEHRIALGKSSIPRYKGKQVGYSKLLRHKKCVARRKYAFLEGINGQPLTKGLFSNIIPFDKRV
jgi:hypothetical protein